MVSVYPVWKLTIIQGDPGDGKTTLVLNIAAKLSKGEGLDSEMKLSEPMNVIYQSAEDGLADTVKPRLELAGADSYCMDNRLRNRPEQIVSVITENGLDCIYDVKF